MQQLIDLPTLLYWILISDQLVRHFINVKVPTLLEVQLYNIDVAVV